MTPTGRQLDEQAAHHRALAVAEGLKKRIEVRHEHTQQIVRQEISEDVQRLFVEGIAKMNAVALRLPALEARIMDLEKAMRDILRKAEDLAKANEAA